MAAFQTLPGKTTSTHPVPALSFPPPCCHLGPLLPSRMVSEAPSDSCWAESKDFTGDLPSWGSPPLSAPPHESSELLNCLHLTLRLKSYVQDDGAGLRWRHQAARITKMGHLWISCYMWKINRLFEHDCWLPIICSWTQSWYAYKGTVQLMTSMSSSNH